MYGKIFVPLCYTVPKFLEVESVLSDFQAYEDYTLS